MLANPDEDDRMMLMTALQNLDRVSSNYSTVAGAPPPVGGASDSGLLPDFASLVSQDCFPHNCFHNSRRRQVLKIKIY